MVFYLFVLFTVVPFVELMLLLMLGQYTEWWVPIVLVLVTALLGAVLARWQGWRIVQQIQQDLAAKRMPTESILDGLLILAAGIFLVSPGVLTDVAGIALLIPPLRHIVKGALKLWFARQVQVRAAGFTKGDSTGGQSAGGGDRIVDAQVIETRVEDAE